MLGGVALSSLALAAPPAPPTGAVVKGRIAGQQKLVNPVWNDAKDAKAHRYQFREPSPGVGADVRGTLTGHLPRELCIAVLGEKGAPEKAPLMMRVSGGRTLPVTLVVAEGQNVVFQNDDPFPHTLYDVGKGGFVATETPSGKSRSWTPPGPGKYEIRDKTSPSVRSWIVVEPRTVRVAYPDRKGEFQVDLEPGKYKLRGYFAGEPVGSELDVTVVSVAPVNLLAPLVVGEVPAAAPPGAPGAPPKPGVVPGPLPGKPAAPAAGGAQ